MSISTQFTGRLTRGPELRTLQSGQSLASLRLAVEGLGRGNSVGFVDVSSFGPGAKAAAEQLGKGRLVEVIGRWEQHEWSDGDGARRSRYGVVGQIRFLDYPKSQQAAAEAPAGEATEGASEAETAPEPQSAAKGKARRRKAS